MLDGMTELPTRQDKLSEELLAEAELARWKKPLRLEKSRRKRDLWGTATRPPPT